MKVLLEMRPALDGHGGIPQETRLLFRGLEMLETIEVAGLLQSGNLVIASGLPVHAPHGRRIPVADQIDRLSKVVVSLQQGPAAGRVEYWRTALLRIVGPVGAVAMSALGRRVPLTRFDPDLYRDFVWRAMFAKSLPAGDFDAVTLRDFRIMRWPWSIVHAVGIATGALGHAIYPRLDTKGFDVMIAETPYPGRVDRSTTLVVRYHDAVPLLMPHTIKDRGYHQAMHFRALKRNAADGAWFACVSESTRRDLLSVLPEVEERAVTIPNMIAPQFLPDASDRDRIPEIVWSRAIRTRIAKQDLAPLGDGPTMDQQPFLLAVSTIEPRKNHLALLDAWEMLRSSGHPELRLILVGSLGWEHESIIARLLPWIHRGLLYLLHEVPPADLVVLYRHALATVCPSLSEGFDYSGVEAMTSGGVVVASDIPVHREIYGKAAEYFSPYAPEELAAAVHRLAGPDGGQRCRALRQEGQEVAERYAARNVLPLWERFFGRLEGWRRSA